MTTMVRTATAAVLAHPDPDALDIDLAFKDLGIDSLTALQLRNTLARSTGLTLPAALVFDHPTPTALAKYLLAEYCRDGAIGPSPLEEELKRLEERLEAAEAKERRHVADRLRALLVAITDDGRHVGERIQPTMTPEEVFQMIDAEFGGDDK